ncbi:hypothetical protein GQ53DRAFT_92827 [Thozetella sp. PMI_491]|nr:hypothetical protein GQ53DRAFT_92827 [Thozetella sp. PMI_491]
MAEAAAESYDTCAMRCYAVPYGIVGFLSHCFHLYLGYCILRRKTPLWPTRRLNYVTYDTYIAFLWFAGLVTLNAINVFDSRCDGTTHSKVRIVSLEHLVLVLLNTLLLAFSFNKRIPIIATTWVFAALDVAGICSDYFSSILGSFSADARASTAPAHKQEGTELIQETAGRESRELRSKKGTIDLTFFRENSITIPLLAVPYAIYAVNVAQKSESWVNGGVIKTVTVIYGILGGLILAWSLGGFYSIRRRGKPAESWAMVWYGNELLAELTISYSTWALASAANDLQGLVIGDEFPVARYWAYFAVSKLPIFMI